MKKILYLVFIMVLCFAFAGCGNNQNNSNNGNNSDGLKNGTVVYFNPEINSKCTEIDYNNNIGASDTENTSGCMKWYLFNDSKSATTLNLLLDHNTTATVAWNESKTNNEEPVTLNAKLASDTSNWHSNIKNTVRAITADEVAKITGHPTFNSKTTSWDYWFLFDTNEKPDGIRDNDCKLSECKYGWLYDRVHINCEKSGCLNNATGPSKNQFGYWTSSNAVNANQLYAWFVGGSGGYDRMSSNPAGPYSGYNIGARPVITVSK